MHAHMCTARPDQFVGLLPYLRAHLIKQQDDDVESAKQRAADVELRGERDSRVVPVHRADGLTTFGVRGTQHYGLPGPT